MTAKPPEPYVVLLLPAADDLRAAGAAVPDAEVREVDARALARDEDQAAFIVDLRGELLSDAVASLRRRDLFVPIVAVVGDDDVAGAMAALRAGANEYVVGPIVAEKLALALSRARTRSRNAQSARLARRDARYPSLVGSSPPMERLIRDLQALEDVDTPTVLITGESGVGKDLVARAIHAAGPRAGRPFVEVDCASIPESLVESHLFGHERGAFTDAKEMKRGLFELARGGTVFLDEIGELPAGTQAKLLRALETRRFKRVGGTAELVLDAGVLSATNRDLRADAANGVFRADLFYRLSVVTLHVPPLRERLADVPDLVAHFVRRFNDALHRDFEGADPLAMRALATYAWPGNVRELRNVIERAMILNRDETSLRIGHLPPELVDRPDAATHDTHARRGDVYELPDEGVDLNRLESTYVAQALERAGGNQTRAAALLGISRFALRHRAEKLGLLAAMPAKRGRPKKQTKPTAEADGDA